jgi:ribosomal protein S18 acetylase RimI-like enzyme
MATPSIIAIQPAQWPADRDLVGGLFREYIASLGVDLAFQEVDVELVGLPGKYAKPGGEILIARAGNGDAIGCVALRPAAAEGACEMKRLYVRPAGRGQSLGRRLAEAVIALARAAGYRRMLLDTLAPMREAQALYASLGFKPIAPYYENPLPGARYMALDL